MMEKQDKGMEKLNLYVIGMTCATCARTVEKAISKLPGVKLATVNLATNSAFIILEKPLEFEEIKKAVERVGYGISTEQPEEEERRRHKRVKRNFLLSISFTLPLVILMVLHMLKFHIPYFPWIEIAIGAVVLFVAGFLLLALLRPPSIRRPSGSTASSRSSGVGSSMFPAPPF